MRQLVTRKRSEVVVKTTGIPLGQIIDQNLDFGQEFDLLVLRLEKHWNNDITL